MRIRLILLGAALLGGISANATTAYDYQAGSVGNTAYPYPLGMAFDVNSTITVTALGVFDSGGQTLAQQLNVYIYDVQNSATPLVTQFFTPGNPGTLVNGELFITLATPLVLNAGFQGMIVAEGFGASQLAGNAGIGGFTASTLDDGGGAISFVGTSYYASSNGVFPTNPDGGPANRYGAGTFQFTANLGGVPEPGTLGLALTGLACVALLKREQFRRAASGQ